ncbi:hypothetical protein RSOL_108040 [Rhizoctonia solani AG-3 Rhs1AP]|uniref:Uncharacterized protein n=2 Tax=Rhizoctonia solani AG-3 TaxID=1086053 RepID=A0A074SDL5_9AGAM|nr:hypothetical protein RSOL_108040 [Rhizoctonia solani AG-3 Rhs1AP]KEP48137.1 hypothetical protein V565_132990 [Rhizoctonia solani 123E]
MIACSRTTLPQLILLRLIRNRVTRYGPSPNVHLRGKRILRLRGKMLAMQKRRTCQTSIEREVRSLNAVVGMDESHAQLLEIGPTNRNPAPTKLFVRGCPFFVVLSMSREAA